MPAADYVPNRVWQEYPSTATLLHAADLNNIELGLQDASASAHQALAAAAASSGASIVAPAPSGGDDSSILQPLLTQAQTTGGTLILRAGTYRANLATGQSFQQPRIIGQGKNHTTLQGFVNTAPVLRFKGGSGQFSGGYLADLTITGTGGIGFEIADACGVRWNRLEFGGTLAEGLRFHNESANGFSEFNHGDAEFASTVILPVNYRRSGGAESFHGTGLTHGTVFNQRAGQTTPVIQIGAGCFPYNAPLSAAFFTRTTAPLIAHLNLAGNRYAGFWGHITIENVPGNNSAVLVDPAQNVVEYSGNVTLAGALDFQWGNFRFNDMMYYNDGGLSLWHKVNKVTVPTSSTSPGMLGHIAADASYFYVCTATDTWRRVALSTF